DHNERQREFRSKGNISISYRQSSQRFSIDSSPSKHKKSIGLQIKQMDEVSTTSQTSGEPSRDSMYVPQENCTENKHPALRRRYLSWSERASSGCTFPGWVGMWPEKARPSSLALRGTYTDVEIDDMLASRDTVLDAAKEKAKRQKWEINLLRRVARLCSQGEIGGGSGAGGGSGNGGAEDDQPSRDEHAGWDDDEGH
ncbi:hypothetical protein Tco_1257921, partial [Tanacetum coccineum]